MASLDRDMMGLFTSLKSPKIDPYSGKDINKVVWIEGNFVSEFHFQILYFA